MSDAMRSVMGCLLVLSGLAVAVDASADDRTGVTVVVLEPTSEVASKSQFGFSASVGESRFETGDATLNGLAKAKGSHLAILVHEDLPMSAVLTVVSLASKAGYSDYTVFVFDRERKGMAKVPSFRWLKFSVDQSIVGSLIQ